ncbi:MAG TPA: TetR/AcrR family transcriptional regulator [Acidimicrobiales bacterium]|jgi:AcrR family transcriptional regulator|nr:TetR/AcrR family transcriptional regulator [Acidimicrobiales bacterium]
MATDTRERLVEAGSRLFQRQGLAGTGIKQILSEANAQFSSLYHHFPGGKDELAVDVIRASGLHYQQLVETVWDAAPDVVTGVRAIFEGAAAVLEATDYADACPIATVALEVASTNEPLRVATAEVFDAWTHAGTARFVDSGVGAAESRRLALTVIALLEGAFVLGRATRSVEPMASAAEAAVTVVRRALDLLGSPAGSPQ